MERSGILRNRSPLRPTPRFLVPVPDDSAKSAKPLSHNQSSHKRGRNSQPTRLFTVPAILAHLEKKYSEEQLNRVPPVFISSYNGGTATLAEPYAVTLRRAVENNGDGVLVKRRKNATKQTESLKKRSSRTVTFATWCGYFTPSILLFLTRLDML